MKDVFIALGTNLGDKKANLKLAIDYLGRFITDIQESALYESAPMYVEDQPSFVNMAIRGKTELDADALLEALKELEEEIGRLPTFRNGPRVIDLDILYHGDTHITTDHLSIPHIRIHEREFVLFPLCDLAPDYFDIRQNKTIQQMTDALGDMRGLKRIA